MIEQVVITPRDESRRDISQLGKGHIVLLIEDPAYGRKVHLLIRPSQSPTRMGNMYVFQHPDAALLKVHTIQGDTKFFYEAEPRFFLEGDGTLSWTNPVFSEKVLPRPSDLYRKLGVLEGNLFYSPQKAVVGPEKIREFLFA